MKEKPTIAISPISNSYLTEGEEYEIIEWDLDDDGFVIIDDCGEEIYCLVEYCAHIDMEKWILK